METLVLKIPRVEHGGIPFDYAVYLAAKLYEDAVMTAGQAAQVAGLSKRGFIELLGKYGVSLFSVREEELIADLSNV